jgi:hypothetical protein
LKKSTKFEEFECMEYIHDKIIHITKFEILIYISKLGLCMELLGEISSSPKTPN